MPYLSRYSEQQLQNFPFCEQLLKPAGNLPSTHDQQASKTVGQNGQQPWIYTIYVSPTPYHPLGASFDITPADRMTVDQTANWISTLGWYHGWAEEAHRYHENFRDYNVSGSLLPELTDEFLKSTLGVENERHRLLIISTIRKLFPNITVEAPEFLSPPSYVTRDLVPSVTSNNALDWEYRSSDHSGTPSLKSVALSQISGDFPRSSDTSVSCSSKDSIGTDTTESSYDTGSDCVQKDHQIEDNIMRKLESGTNKLKFCESSSKKTEMIICDPLSLDEPNLRDERSCRSRKLNLRKRTLFVNLRQDQILDDQSQQINLIRKQLDEISTDVDIRPTTKNRYIYTLVFPNCTLANEALSLSDDREFKLIKNWLHRPRPSRPVKYRALYTLNINS